LKQESEYEKAIALCKDLPEGGFIKSVLKTLMEKAEKANKLAEESRENANSYHRKWKASMEAAAKIKEKFKNRLEKQKAEIAALEKELKTCEK